MRENFTGERNGKDRDKYGNPCYVNNCHHNADEPKTKERPWRLKE